MLIWLYSEGKEPIKMVKKNGNTEIIRREKIICTLVGLEFFRKKITETLSLKI